jgi:hypothetical protein
VAFYGSSGKAESAEERRDNAEAQSSQRCAEEEGTMYRAPTTEKANGEEREIVLSEASGPLSGGVKDAKDFDGVCTDSIGTDVGRIANDQFART